MPRQTLCFPKPVGVQEVLAPERGPDGEELQQLSSAPLPASSDPCLDRITHWCQKFMYSFYNHSVWPGGLFFHIREKQMLEGSHILHFAHCEERVHF